jgi:hypothetical protein
MKKDSPQTLEVAKQLNRSVLSVITSDQMQGFEKAYLISDAISELKDLLTTDYMRPILQLQGNKLGFKTDKDNTGGYPAEIVKNCLIEAVLTGVQPFGNQFNIIAGNMYVTKEGFGHLLSKIPALSYKIIPELPRIKENNTGAAIVMNVEWTYHGVTKSEKLDIPVKMNAYMGTDAVIGKATRKARCWLFNTINGTEIADGDVTDIAANVVSSTINGEAIKIEDLQFLFDSKKNTLTEEERANVERIINSHEEKSYTKAFKFLQAK